MISNKISEKASDKATAENKAEKKFDEFQTAAIQAKNNSVVSAGAGSGKTTVLANRFLELLKPKSQGGSGFHVDEILTLTFTKKATVEMSSRIYKVLRNNTDPQIKKEAANFYKANIHTLDSYCNSVAKMGCNFYGISPNFTQDDDEIESQAKKIALPLILSNKENEGIKKIVSANKYEEIAEQLFINPVLKHSTIVEPLDFKKMLDFQIESAKEIWNENCQKATKIITDMKNIYDNTEKEVWRTRGIDV